MAIKKANIIGKLFILNLIIHYILFSREIYCFLRKLLIVFIVGYFKGFNQVEAKAILVIFVLIFFLIMHVNNSPFITKRLNDFELKEIMSCILIMLAGLLSHIVHEFEAEILIVIILILVNIFFFCEFVREFFLFILFSLMNVKKFQILQKLFNKNLLGKFFLFFFHLDLNF